MTFEENQEWVNEVTKPDNLDYNVAEKTTLTFSSPHGYIVGDFLTEDVTGAYGVVYNLIDVYTIEVARYNEIQFPETGTVNNGSSSPQGYNQAVIEHGINNQVLQDLVDRSGWLKTETERLTNRDITIENKIDNNETWLFVSNNFTATIDKKYLVDISGGNVVATLPNISLPGRFITFVIEKGDLNLTSFSVRGGENNIEGSSDVMKVDLFYPFRAIYVGGSTGWKIVGD